MTSHYNATQRVRPLLRRKLPALLLCFVLSGCSGSQSSDPEGVGGPAQAEIRLTQLADKIVGIETLNKSGQVLASGHGFLVGDEGVVVTSAQLVAVPGCHTVTILFGSTRHSVEEVAHFDSGSDLASLTLQLETSPTGFELRTKAPVVGEPVSATYRKGDTETTEWSTGLISAVHYKGVDPVLMMATAPLTARSSGIPLLDEMGRVVGMTTLALRQSEILLTGIPTDRIRKFLDEPGSRIPIAQLLARRRREIATDTILQSRPSLTGRELFRRVAPAIAQILMKDRSGKITGSGSGFLVDAGGRVVTNAHVIVGVGNVEAIVGFGDIKYTVDEVYASDRKIDLAILRIDLDVSGDGFPLLELARARPTVGRRVFAIGSPFGYSNTLSAGIVSGIRVFGDNSEAIQTTAPISPGSSGGPLIDEFGHVVGVTTFGDVRTRGTVTISQNLNFAISTRQVLELLDRPETPRPISQVQQGSR